MMDSKFPYLMQRGERYYFRIAVPRDLQAKFMCREIVKSLKTSSERDAVRLCVQMTDKVQEVFSLAYAQEGLNFKSLAGCYIQTVYQGYLSSFRASVALESVVNQPTKELNGYLPSELFPKFLEEKDITCKTVMAYQSSFSIWLDVVGDRILDGYDKKDALKYKEALLVRPKNKRGDPISKKKVQDHMNVIHAFFKWAIDVSFYSGAESPFKGLRIRLLKSTQNERYPFTKEQINKLFSSPVYTGCQSEYRRSLLGDLVMRDSLYWVPLIAYYTGMRMNEICQLKQRDIKQEDSIYYIDVTDDAHDTRLKTKSSRRKVPLHPHLIELGFIAHIEPILSHKRIFSDIPIGPDGTYSFSFSKKFARYLNK